VMIRSGVRGQLCRRTRGGARGCGAMSRGRLPAAGLLEDGLVNPDAVAGVSAAGNARPQRRLRRAGSSGGASGGQRGARRSPNPRTPRTFARGQGARGGRRRTRDSAGHAAARGWSWRCRLRTSRGSAPQARQSRQLRCSRFVDDVQRVGGARRSARRRSGAPHAPSSWRCNISGMRSAACRNAAR
jgi:hypothetical protein